MRHQTRTFVEQFLAKHPGEFKTVLEVGSRDINGNIRDLFAGIDYTGVDMQEGGSVTEAVNGHDLKGHFREKQFNLVCCFDMLEHDDKFWLTIENMREVLAPGGYLLIGVPSRNCPLHEHPSDYWRFMPAAVEGFFREYEDFHMTVELDDEIYASGRKPE